MRTLFTIGHSRHPVGHFIRLLEENGIRALADVRSYPYSKWAPQYQKSRLAGSLETAGIRYVFLGAELGGRPPGSDFYDRRGRLNEARRAMAPDFQEGIARLEEMAKAHPTALMCAEEDPRRCHRKRLLAPVLEERGARVVHIRGDGRTEENAGQADAGPPAQGSLFGGG